MMSDRIKTYVTFGQTHVHRIDNTTFDADCVAIIEHSPSEDSRTLVFEYFGEKFCFTYDEKFWKENHESTMGFYLRGYITPNR